MVKKIMIVDDDKEYVEELKDMLSVNNYYVTTYTS